ncbi:MAG: beta-ketoacyl-[acyl-carrier-protein] synthase family protein [Flavobacteriales bacterium]|nr:beta-ketoacyl-[acyl-carrier-protein] synthase family protein [Flavobacteriales bacterium]
MNPSAVAITGIGAISALGAGTDAQLDGLRKGRSGIGHLEVLDLPFPELFFGEVKLSSADLAARIGDRADRSRTALLAILAAQEALEHIPEEERRNMAVISASTVGGMDRSERVAIHWLNGDLAQAGVAFGHPVGDHATLLADRIGANGFITTLSTACSSSANAIMLGAWLLRTGRADLVLAGGADALCRFTIEGFRSLSAMDTQPCRPFSDDRGGMNLGEGAAYLVLETIDHARGKGREPLALVRGAANTNDAHHQTATSPDGEGPFQAMRQALAEAGLAPMAIDLINAHGTGTENNDVTEQTAMERLFDAMPPFVSTKSATGHTLAAAGALEAVFSVLSIRHGFIPINLRTTSPIAGLHSAPTSAVIERPIGTVLSTSFGFGGNDSALVISKV